MYQYPAINTTNCCFDVKKIKLLLGWTSGFFYCKIKGLKRSKTATSNFFRTLKFFEIGIKNWTFANFGPNLRSILIFLDQIYYQFWINFPNFMVDIWLEKCFRQKTATLDL